MNDDDARPEHAYSKCRSTIDTYELGIQREAKENDTFCDRQWLLGDQVIHCIGQHSLEFGHFPIGAIMTQGKAYHL